MLKINSKIIVPASNFAVVSQRCAIAGLGLTKMTTQHVHGHESFVELAFPSLSKDDAKRVISTIATLVAVFGVTVSRLNVAAGA